MKPYIKLLRVTHYIKNLLILTPVFFSKGLFLPDSMNLVVKGLIATVVFCFACSAIYVINDIGDIDKDKNHPTKCKRPIASGAISVKRAYSVLVILLIIVAIGAVYLGSYPAVLLVIYIALNLGYSKGLKNIPLIDILIVAVGYLIRVYYGAVVMSIFVSSWLYLTVLAAAFYLVLGKRRNELLNSAGDTRNVLKKYSVGYLEKNKQMFLGLTIAFYSLWAAQIENNRLLWTVPIIMLLFMRYDFDVENNIGGGDPVEVVLSDKILLVLCFLLVLVMFISIYGDILPIK